MDVMASSFKWWNFSLCFLSFDFISFYDNLMSNKMNNFLTEQVLCRNSKWNCLAFAFLMTWRRQSRLLMEKVPPSNVYGKACSLHSAHICALVLCDSVCAWWLLWLWWCGREAALTLCWRKKFRKITWSVQKLCRLSGIVYRQAACRGAAG